jgi:hypothetical protein
LAYQHVGLAEIQRAAGSGTLFDTLAVFENYPLEHGALADRGCAKAGGRAIIDLFSDLKRHDMGPINAARHEQRGVARAQYLTPRLWGAADSAPYLHDGRARLWTGVRIRMQTRAEA